MRILFIRATLRVVTYELDYIRLGCYIKDCA